MTEMESPRDTVTIGKSLDGNLPDVVASLEMLTVTSRPNNSSELGTKRTLRKRIPKPKPITEVRNRRCTLRPQKRSAAEMESEDAIKNYYLDRKVRRKPNNLETIYEEMDGEVVSTSSRRFKRLIEFETTPSDAKMRKRCAKIKRLFGSRVKLKNGGISSMQTLIKKLNSIRSDSPNTPTDKNLQLPKVFECVL